MTTAALLSARTPAISELHDSVLMTLSSLLGAGSKLALASTCSHFQHLGTTPMYWQSIDVASEPMADAKVVLACLHKAKGGVEVLKLCDSGPDAAARESAARFKQGLRYYDPPPYFLGGTASALAALLPNIMDLRIDERTCCLGGMTDDFAKAIAEHCPQLERLEVAFARGPIARLAAERFTDEGLCAIAERCTNLQALVLRHCTAITDRSCYALAASCKQLQEVRIHGYSEAVSDSGLALLLASAGPRLTTCQLSSKLTRTSDASMLALLHRLPMPVPTVDEDDVGMLAMDSETEQPSASASTNALATSWAGHICECHQHEPAIACGVPNLHTLKLGGNLTDLSLAALVLQLPYDCHNHQRSLCPNLVNLQLSKCYMITAQGVVRALASGALPALKCLTLPASVAAALPQQLPSQHGHVLRLQVTPGMQSSAVYVTTSHSV